MSVAEFGLVVQKNHFNFRFSHRHDTWIPSAHAHVARFHQRTEKCSRKVRHWICCLAHRGKCIFATAWWSSRENRSDFCFRMDQSNDI